MPEYLTDATIKALVPRSERYEISDEGEPGLRLRVLPAGDRVWSFWYRNAAGASRRVRLDVYPDLTLSAARKRAKALSVAVAKGEDPAAEREAARAAHVARKAAARVSDLCDDFVKDQSKAWRPATRAGWVRYIEADIKPGIGKLIPREVTADDIIRFLEALKAKRGPVSVARCFEVVRRVFRWAVARRKLPADPCSGLDAKELVAKARVSDRVFTDDELVCILAGAAATEQRLLVPWVLYTGARGGEARSAEWRDIDEKAKVWTIPAEKSKNAETHRVPLSKGALAVLDELRGRSERWLFPAPTREGFMDRSQKATERVSALSGVEDFNLHHLRRTLRQRLTDAGVALHVAEAVLGHLPPKMVRTYSPQWEPLREMRTALEAWSRELSRIARGQERQTADVLPMARA